MKLSRSYSSQKVWAFWIVLLTSLFLPACQPASKPNFDLTLPAKTAENTINSSPVPTLIPTSTNTPAPTPTETVLAVWVQPELFDTIRAQLDFAPGVMLATSQDQAQARLEVGREQPVGNLIYTLVTPFPTVEDQVSADVLKSTWAGFPVNNSFDGLPLLMDQNTLANLTSLWGSPAQGAVKVIPSEKLLQTAWENQVAWAIIPFDALEPRWKVLQIDGESPLHKDFDLQTYALTIPISFVGGKVEDYLNSAVLSNRDPERLTTVMITGVTALVRATAETMRRNGLTYPAQDIAPWLLEADILHVSNEVPFDPDCPQPNPLQTELVFCSRPEYIELLEYITTDAVELSGDHFADAGPDAMRFTLDLYKEVGIPYYGGGYNEEDARKPLLFEHNGNKIAFLGCNGKGGGYATARGDNPGAVECDYDYLADEIAQLKDDGYLPIVTVQHFEYYTFEPQPKLIESFRRLAQDGAAIVSGSQAHQPHGLEFFENSFIHYGLGNLFFDQYHLDVPTDIAFIDRHIVYAGRHISTELLGIKFVDFARPRPMTPEERQDLLERAFEASLW